MEPRLVRRDFVPVDTPCARLASDGRTHTVRSGKAWIIEKNGVERPYGPACAAEIMGGAFAAARRMAPDLTTHDLMKDEGGGEGGAGGSDGGGRGERDGELHRHALAAAYLTLRNTALASVPEINPAVNNYDQLVALHSSYQAKHALTSDEVDAVLRIEDAAQNKAYVFCRRNLMTVYAAYHQLQRLRKKARREIGSIEQKPWKNQEAQKARVERLEGNIARIDSVCSQLLKKLYISDAQVKMVGLELPVDAFPPDRCNPPKRPAT